MISNMETKNQKKQAVEVIDIDHPNNQPNKITPSKMPTNETNQSFPTTSTLNGYQVDHEPKDQPSELPETQTQ